MVPLQNPHIRGWQYFGEIQLTFRKKTRSSAEACAALLRRPGDRLDQNFPNSLVSSVGKAGTTPKACSKKANSLRVKVGGMRKREILSACRPGLDRVPPQELINAARPRVVLNARWGLVGNRQGRAGNFSPECEPQFFPFSGTPRQMVYV